MTEQQTWETWGRGESRCPICTGASAADFATLCDCWQFEREFPNWKPAGWQDGPETVEVVFP